MEGSVFHHPCTSIKPRMIHGPSFELLSPEGLRRAYKDNAGTKEKDEQEPKKKFLNF